MEFTPTGSPHIHRRSVERLCLVYLQSVLPGMLRFIPGRATGNVCLDFFETIEVTNGVDFLCTLPILLDVYIFILNMEFSSIPEWK